MPTWPGIPAGYKEPLIEIATGLFPDETMDVLEGLFGGGGNNDGRVVHTGPNTLSGVNDTLDDAEAAGPYTIAYFPPGVYNLGTGLSLSGRTAQIQGAGAGGYDSGAYTGTVFRAASQDGPVIDFTGWVVPEHSSGEAFTSRVRHGGFAVVGSGVGDASKDNAGVRLTRMSSASFHDITVTGTGGPCWEHVASPGDAVYLCDFDRITLVTPVSVATNDVPYMILNESNGSRFSRIGFRGINSGVSVGAGGALVITGNSSFTGYDLTFDSCWFEYMNVPTNGCIINAKVNRSFFERIGWHDCFKVSGATNTAYMRLNVPDVDAGDPHTATNTNLGGNVVTGVIPGKYDSATSIDAGVEVFQFNNRIVGVRGFRQNNVVIKSGVVRSYVEIAGSESSPVGDAIIDNSGSTGNSSNVLVDTVLGRRVINRVKVADADITLLVLATLASFGTMDVYSDLRLYNAAGSGPGFIQYGAGGPLDLAGAGTPEGAVVAPVGSTFRRTNGGAATSFYVKESGAGSTGWVAK